MNWKACIFCRGPIRDSESICRDCQDPDFDESQSVTGGESGGDYFDAFDDCGMLSDGTCLKAGSEECDWECRHPNKP